MPLGLLATGVERHTVMLIALGPIPMPSTLPGEVFSSDAIRLALRSWPEVDTYLEQCKGVIIPLGSTEQHGPARGPLGTDALTAEAVALELGRRSGVLVTPAPSLRSRRSGWLI